MLMTRSLIILFTITAINSIASASSDLQSWNTFTISGSKNNFQYSIQTEGRYSLEEAKVYEEHFKPYVGYNTPIGEFGFVFSFLADEVFTKTFEKRYALQYSKDLFMNNDLIYEVRLRQEFRDFSDQSSIAQRFRLRNQFELIGLSVKNWIPYTNSEFNIYTNKTLLGPRGFSSHRFILGITRGFQGFEFGISFTHNYKKFKGETEVRYSLGANVEVEF